MQSFVPVRQEKGTETKHSLGKQKTFSYLVKLRVQHTYIKDKFYI